MHMHMHTFLQYRWETAEQIMVERRVAELAQVCTREESHKARLVERAKAMAERVEARRAELDHARRRDSELRLLSGLAAFVTDNFASSAALQPARGGDEVELADDARGSMAEFSARHPRQKCPCSHPPTRLPTTLEGLRLARDTPLGLERRAPWWMPNLGCVACPKSPPPLRAPC